MGNTCMRKAAAPKALVRGALSLLLASACACAVPVPSWADGQAGQAATSQDASAQADESGKTAAGAQAGTGSETGASGQTGTSEEGTWEEPLAKTGLVKEDGSYRFYKKDGTLLKSSWKTIGGKRYYFGAKGKAACGKAKKIGGAYWIFGNKAALLTGKKRPAAALASGTYAVDAQGHPLRTGFRISSGKLSHYSKAGKLAQGTTVDGIVFKKSGVARNDNATKLKIAIVQQLAKITEPSWSKARKLQASWKWVRAHTYSLTYSGYLGGSFPYSDIGRQGWVQRCALRVMKTNVTACYGYACTFAMFAHELGYKAVVWAAADSPKQRLYHHGYAIVAGKRWDNIPSHPYVGHKRRYRVVSYSEITGVWKGEAAQAPSTAEKAKAGWNAAKTQLTLANGKLACGPTVYKKKLYLFSSKGVYRAAKTKKARKAAVKNGPCATLLELLGTPKKTYTIALCEPVPGKEGGSNRTRQWANMVLTTYVDTAGTEYFLSYAAR